MADRVLVTGGAGFVGSHLVDALVERGHQVVVLDNLHPGAHRETPGYLNPAAEYLWGDLRDPEETAAAVRGATAVSHQGGMVGLGSNFGDVAAYVAHNDLGTAGLLLALHRARFQGPLVLAGSMVVYGEGGYRCPRHGAVRPGPRDPARLAGGDFEPRCPSCRRRLVPEPVTEEAPTDPRSVYAATKLHQEHLCTVFAREHGVPLTVLRYHNVYGPRMPRDTQYSGVAAIFRSALEAGHPPPVFEDGRQTRDFVHVRDVALANVLALEAAARGTFNVATGDPRTVGDMAGGLAAAFGGPAPEITGRFRLGDVRHVFASTERAHRMLGFRARVPFEEGVRELAGAALRGAAPARPPVARVRPPRALGGAPGPA
ncbi:MAG: NAD-dependent epimerase/dehydratase family protein [Actinomycetota bacterium]